eukprot:875729_1
MTAPNTTMIASSPSVLPKPAFMVCSSDIKSMPASIRETIIAQLPEGQFTESLVAQLMEKVMKEKQSLEQGAMQPSFKSVTGKGGIKVIDGSSFAVLSNASPAASSIDSPSSSY